MILLTDGQFISFGDNSHGQLGHDDNEIRTRFKLIKRIPENISEIACSGWCTFIRLTDGKLLSCGHNG